MKLSLYNTRLHWLWGQHFYHPSHSKNSSQSLYAAIKCSIFITYLKKANSWNHSLIQKFSNVKYSCVCCINGKSSIWSKFHFYYNSITHSGRIQLNQIACFVYVLWSIIYLYSHTLCSCHCSFTENSSIFMAVYTIRLLMWRMLDNSWVMWPRQRFPLIALTCQYKWELENVPWRGGQWGGKGLLQIFNEEKGNESKSLESKLNDKKWSSPYSYWIDINV